MDRGGRGIAQAMMVAVAFMTIFPLYFIIITAFKTREEYLTNQFLPPSDPTLENLREAFRDGQLLTWVGNSIVITIASVVLAAVVSALAAYPLARSSFPGRLPVHRAQHRADGRPAGRAGRAALPVLRRTSAWSTRGSRSSSSTPGC